MDAEMIEKVARAIYEQESLFGCDFGSETERSKDFYRRLARAAIAALPATPQAAQVPDDAMVERALKVLAFEDDGAVFPDAYSDEEAEYERTKMRRVLNAAMKVTP